MGHNYLSSFIEIETHKTAKFKYGDTSITWFYLVLVITSCHIFSHEKQQDLKLSLYFNFILIDIRHKRLA